MEGSREADENRAPAGKEPPSGHTVLIGYGRVGRMLGLDLAARREPLIVIESDAQKARLAEEEDGHGSDRDRHEG